MNRNLRMIIVADTNSEEGRRTIDELAELPIITRSVVTPQMIRAVLPGFSASPAVGVLFWASDLQGIVTDVEEFAAYLKNEEYIINALNLVGIKTKEESKDEN